MAIGKSKILVKLAFENSIYMPNIKIRVLRKLVKIFLIKYFKLYRWLVLIVKKKLLHKLLPFFIKKSNIESQFKIKELSFLSNKYVENNYLFLNDFIDKENYEKLKLNFPSNKIYFKLKNDPTKFYYWGFEYHFKKEYLDSDKVLIDCFPELKSYYNFLMSNSFFKQIGYLLNKDGFVSKYKIISLNCTLAFEKSFLIPHKDTSYLNDETNLGVKSQIHNIIHFIDGNNTDVVNSGGTSLYLDNEFKKLVDKPKSLKNTAIIYNTKADYFHGFNFMKKNMYRKAIGIQIEQMLTPSNK